jgi:hypothetical protein
MVTVALSPTGGENRGTTTPRLAAAQPAGEAWAMTTSDVAELSTIGAQLEDLARRVELVGDRYRESPDSAVSSDIDLAERSLIAARRALAHAARTLADLE